MKVLSILLLTFLYTLNLFSQSKDTAFQIGGFYEDRITASTKLADGNLLFAGLTSNSAYVSDTLTPFTTENDNDIFLVKLKPDGTVVWQKTFTGKGYEAILTIVEDSENNIYLGGYFTDDFKAETIDLPGSFETNSLLVKINSNGSIIWAKTYESDKRHSIVNLTIDESGNIYVAGIVTGSFLKAEDYTYNIGMTNYSSFLTKYKKDGSVIWIKLFYNQNGVSINSIANKNGKILFGGSTTAGELKYNSINTGKHEDLTGALIGELTNEGDISWIKFWSSRKSFATAVAKINKTTDGLYALLHVQDSINIDGLKFKTTAQDDVDILVLKLNDTGSVKWSKFYGSADFDFIDAFAVDGFENLYITSNFVGKLKVEERAFTAKESELALVKLSSNGNLINVKLTETDFHGIGTVYGPGGIIIMPNNDVIVSGWFNSKSKFSGRLLSNRGNHDGFIWRIGNFATGLNEKHQVSKMKLNLFPNPSNGMFSLVNPREINGESNILIYDMCGKVVYKQDLHLQPGKIQNIDIKHFPKGIYMVKLTSGNVFSTEKLVIQ